MMFCGREIEGFVTPGYEATPLLNRPQIAPAPSLRFVTSMDPTALFGIPKAARRTRPPKFLSDLAICIC